jgi:hypothetical protein
LQLLLNSDFKKALKRQRSVLNMLTSYESFALSGDETSGKVTLSRQAEPYALITEDVAENFIHSAAEFFEVHYAHMNPHEPCSFCVNGKIWFKWL